MVKKKACKNCKIFVKGSECPICKSKDLTTSWKGRIVIEDSNKSEIAQKMGIKMKGDYAIKTR
ncbi:DNA-directed RNA polymerase subunit E'' [Candidatus Woesearchaeota archaeon]|nr:DNA-directed RNA polymerase subunit E'' [Candidatus Woesearchaeota archaeon]